MHASAISCHRALMITGVIVLLLVGFGLAAGWRWYFQNLAFREAVVELAKKKQATWRNAEPSILPEASPKTSPGAATSEPAPAAVSPPPPLRLNQLGQPTLGHQRSTKTSTVPESLSVTQLKFNSEAEDVRAAEDLLQTFWHAATWEDKVCCVRDPDRVRPLMQQYYEVRGQKDPLAGALQSRSLLKFGDIEVLHCVYSGESYKGSVEIALLRDDQGTFKLDWESYVAYSEMTWPDFQTSRPTVSKTFRCYAVLDDYYNFEFDDAKRFVSVKILSADGGTSLHAYAERAGSLGDWLLGNLQHGFNALGVTIKLSFPANAESGNCCRIDGVVADRWLTF